MKDIDHGREFDWGRTSKDYANYRDDYPDSYFEKLRYFGVGLPGQHILDIGTGTGLLARRFARNGCKATGLDSDKGQLTEAARLAQEQKVDVEWVVCPAEDLTFEKASFDVVTAAQCWPYFDLIRLIPKLHHILKPNGLLIYSFFAWLPLEDPVAAGMERLVLQHNLDWPGGGYQDHQFSIPAWANGKFTVDTLHKYKEEVPFTREQWRGRIRACRGIGASLTASEVKRFDEAHDRLLAAITGDVFTILHQTCLYIFRKTD